MSVVRPDGSAYKEASSHLTIRKTCFLRSSNFTIFPKKLSRECTSSNAVPIFPIDSLNQLNYFTIHFMTNTLSEFPFLNFPDLESAVDDSLPPSVHIPSLLAPLVLVIVIVIPLYILVKRTLALYTHLMAKVRRTQ